MSLCCGWHGCAAASRNRYSVTHYVLDVYAGISQYKRVKIFFPLSLLTRLGSLLAVCALLVGCKPRGVDMAELTQLQARNTQLQQEIAKMHELIRRAGADTPDLAEQLEARNREVVQAYENLKRLKTQETEVQMRRIELEGRLESFRANFQELQNQVVTTPSTTKPLPQP